MKLNNVLVHLANKTLDLNKSFVNNGVQNEDVLKLFPKTKGGALSTT